MPSEETSKLIDEIGRLSSAAGASVAASNVRLDKALQSLDEIAGRRPTRNSGSGLEASVYRILSEIPGAVVSREPHAPGSSFTPDFLVELGSHRMLVEAQDRGTWLPALKRQVEAALDSYRADEGLVIVPDENEVAPMAEDPADARLKLLGPTHLKEFLSQLVRDGGS